jgi:hypothetical protein
LWDVREILVESKVWFADPTTFNDLFESRPAIELPSESQIDGYAGRAGPKARADSADDGEFEQRMQAMRARMKDEAYIRATLTREMKRVGVLCLVKSPLNSLMWAHYGSNHAGICFEFQSLVGNREPFGFACAVEYRKDRPVLVPTEFDRLAPSEFGSTFIRAKPEEWEYEAEWRCFRAGSGHVRFDPTLLLGVYLGARTDERDAKAIIGLCLSHSSKPKVNQIIMHQRTYELTARTMSSDDLNQRWAGQSGWWNSHDALL